MMNNFENIVARLILIDIGNNDFVFRYPFAGYILFYKDINHNNNGWKDLKDLNNYYVRVFREKFGVNVFSSVDQEGGVVFRFDYPDFPAVFSQFLVKDERIAYRISKLNGLILKYLGFNTNFSPVMDVNTNENNPIIGVRSFGSDHYLVSNLSRQYIRGYKDAGILCTGKHFPGHGDTDIDSHLDLPSSVLTFKHIYPFLANKFLLPSIMTAHVVYRNVDYLPATISKKILNLLPFDGLVFSDALNMKALQNYKWEEILVNSLYAGVDILLILGDDKLKEDSIKFLAKRAQQDPDFEKLIISKYFKVTKFLEKLSLLFSNLKEDYLIKEIQNLKEWMFTYELPLDYKGDIKNFINFLNSEFGKILIISNNYLRTIGVNEKIKNTLTRFLLRKGNNFIEINKREDIEKIRVENESDLLIVNLALDNSCKILIEKLKNEGKNVFIISFSNPYLQGEFVLNIGGFSRVHLYNFERFFRKVIRCFK